MHLTIRMEVVQTMKDFLGSDRNVDCVFSYGILKVASRTEIHDDKRITFGLTLRPCVDKIIAFYKSCFIFSVKTLNKQFPFFDRNSPKFEYFQRIFTTILLICYLVDNAKSALTEKSFNSIAATDNITDMVITSFHDLHG